MQSKVSKIFITTSDTKKTYEYPSKKDSPQLWEVKMEIHCVDNYGNSFSSCSRVDNIFLERETLEQHGLLPGNIKKDTAPNTPSPTVEDLILRLLELVGVYPVE